MTENSNNIYFNENNFRVIFKYKISWWIDCFEILIFKNKLLIYNLSCEKENFNYIF
jgi:hypothetical protein